MNIANVISQRLRVRLAKALKDPFIVCCLIGFVAFAGATIVGGQADPDEIVISDSDITRLQSQWALEQGFPPDSITLDNLIQGYIQEEMQVREALRLGLDYNDTIIRRRLAQKYRFIIEDQALDLTPTEDELLSFYNENKDAYRTSERISFHHIFFRSRPARLDRNGLLTELVSNRRNWLEMGDSFPASRRYTKASHQQIVNAFGNQFLTGLLDVEENKWVGPVPSTFGSHFVRVTEITPPAIEPFAIVRDRVELDYEAMVRDRRYREQIEKLATQYQVTFDTKILDD